MINFLLGVVTTLLIVVLIICWKFLRDHNWLAGGASGITEEDFEEDEKWLKRADEARKGGFVGDEPKVEVQKVLQRVDTMMFNDVEIKEFAYWIVAHSQTCEVAKVSILQDSGSGIGIGSELRCSCGAKHDFTDYKAW